MPQTSPEKLHLGMSWSRRGGLVLLLAVGLQLGLMAFAAAADRMALVIANEKYQPYLPDLRNPVNDSRLIGGKLEELGFEVTRLENAGKDTFNRALRDFARAVSAAGRGTEVVIYFAGHGLQDDRQTNYLIPVDADVKAQSDLPTAAIGLDAVLSTIENARPKIAFVILDACRDNSLPSTTRGTRRGLAPENVRPGLLIAFSTEPGRAAFDGAGSNSPYAEALAAEISKPGQLAEQVFKGVRKRVLEATGDQQVTWESMRLTDDYFFVRAAVPQAGKPVEQPSDRPIDAKPQIPEEDPMVAYGNAVLTDTIDEYQRLLRKYPTHPKKETIQGLIQRKQVESLWNAIERAGTDADKILMADRLLQAFRDSAYAERAEQLRTALLAKQIPTAPNDEPPRVYPAAPTGPMTPTATYYYVTGVDPNGYNWLALRDAPSFDSKWSSTKMGPGTLLTKLGESGEWYRVRLLSGETGWANSRYLACCRSGPESAQAKIPSATTPSSRFGEKSYFYVDGLDPNGYNWLALRDAPSLRSGWSSTQMRPGTLVTKIGQQGEWYKVRLLNGEIGWANSRFLRCCRSNP